MALSNHRKNDKSSLFGQAHRVKPSFFSGSDGRPFGVFTLRENTLTALPKEPQRLYQVGNTVVTDWRLMMLSEDEEELGDTDYFTGIAQLKKHTVAESENHILIKELSVKKLFKILKHCHRKTKEG